MTRSAVKSDYVINIVRKPTTAVPLRVYIVVIARVQINLEIYKLNYKY